MKQNCALADDFMDQQLGLESASFCSRLGYPGSCMQPRAGLELGGLSWPPSLPGGSCLPSAGWFCFSSMQPHILQEANGAPGHGTRGFQEPKLQSHLRRIVKGTQHHLGHIPLATESHKAGPILRGNRLDLLARGV